MTAEEAARAFWCAASYYRREHDRDRSIVIRIAHHLVNNAPAPVQIRAFNPIKEIHGPGTSSDPPRAS